MIDWASPRRRRPRPVRASRRRGGARTPRTVRPCAPPVVSRRGRVASPGSARSSVVLLTAAVGSVSPAGAAPRAPRSSGCAHPGPAGTTTTSIPSGATVRSYRLAVPPGPGPFGLVLNFHGLGSNDVQQAVYSGLEQAGPAAGDVVLTPQGTGRDAFWNILPNLAQPDDVAYTVALIDQTERTECIDPTRVYSTGISNGAGLHAAGCKLTSRLAAIAPVSGVNLRARLPVGSPAVGARVPRHVRPGRAVHGRAALTGPRWAAHHPGADRGRLVGDTRRLRARPPPGGRGVDGHRDALRRLSRRHPGRALQPPRRRPHLARDFVHDPDARRGEPRGEPRRR